MIIFWHIYHNDYHNSHYTGNQYLEELLSNYSELNILKYIKIQSIKSLSYINRYLPGEKLKAKITYKKDNLEYIFYLQVNLDRELLKH